MHLKLPHNIPHSQTLVLSQISISCYIIQCRYLIHALIARAGRAKYTTTHPIATQYAGRVNDLTTECSLDSQDTCIIDVFGLFYLHVIHGCLSNWAGADDRSTAAEIKCLYYTEQSELQKWIKNVCVTSARKFCSPAKRVPSYPLNFPLQL